jgi:hypothetical protein
MGVAKKTIRGLGDYEPLEILGILDRTQAGKGTHTGNLCQKSKGTVEVKQEPAKVGGRTIYRTLSLEGTPLHIGTKR